MTKNKHKKKFSFFYPLSHGISLIFNNFFLFSSCFCRCYVSYCTLLSTADTFFFCCNLFSYQIEFKLSFHFSFIILSSFSFLVCKNCNSSLILECINCAQRDKTNKNGKWNELKKGNI